MLDAPARGIENRLQTGDVGAWTEVSQAGMLAAMRKLLCKKVDQ